MAGNLYDETLEDLDEQQEPAGSLTPAAPPAPPPPTLPPAADNPIIARVRQRQALREAQLRTTLRQASEVNPDQAAEARRLGLQFGAPPAMVLRNLDHFRQRAAAARPVDALQAETPHLAGWLSNPDNAAVAHDDLVPLGMMERAFQWVEQQLGGVLRPFADYAVEAGRVQYEAEYGAPAGEAPIAPVRFASDEVTGALRAGRLGLTSGLVGAAQGISEYALKSGQVQYEAEYGAPAGEAPLKTSDNIADQPEAIIQMHLIRQHLNEAVERARGNRAEAGFVKRSVLGGIESATQMGVLAPLSVLTGSPAPMLLGMGGQTFGTSYGESRDIGKPIATAAARGGFDATVEILTEYYPSKWLVGDLVKNAPLWEMVRHQLLSEVPGELAATTLQNLSQWATDHPQGSLADWVASFKTDYAAQLPMALAETLVSTLVASGLQAGGGKVLASGAAATHRLVTQLGDAASQSKVVERSKEATVDFVQSKVAGTPLEHLHAPIATFTKYWQEQGEDPQAMATALTGDPTAYATAVRQGTDLPLKTARYVALVAGTKHNEFFANELKLDPRLDPEMTNVREVIAQVQTVEQRMQAEAQAAEAGGVTTTGALDQAEQQIVEQLVQTGMAEEDARTNAAALRAPVAAMVTRSELDPADAAEAMLRRAAALIQRFSVAREGMEAAATPGTTLEQRVPLTAERLGGWEQEMRERHGPALSQLDVQMTSQGDLALNMIGVAREAQRQGTGTAIMNDLTRLADEHGVRITLTPDKRAGTTSRKRLVDFYKRFGFVENKGRGKDFGISAGMYREAQAPTTLEQGAAETQPERFGPLQQPLGPANAQGEAAYFIGTQETGTEAPAIPLYTVQGGEHHGTTVTEAELQQWGIPVPPQATGFEGTLYQTVDDKAPAAARFDTAPVRVSGEAAELSTQVPKGANQLPTTEMRRTDMALATSAPTSPGKKPLLERFANEIRDYPQITNAERERAQTPDDLINALIGRMKQNLRYLWNQYEKEHGLEVVKRAAKWYVGAHRIARRLTTEFPISLQQAAAVFASLSPQMDWFKNVALGERTIKWFFQFERDNPKLTDTILRAHHVRELEVVQGKLDAILKKGTSEGDKGEGFVEVEDPQDLANEQWERFLLMQADQRRWVGMRWRDLPLEAKAIMLRGHDELTSKSYRVILPEGDHGPLKRNKDKTEADLGWGAYQFIENAISILQDGRIANISQRLGGEHKVRSFYNNIINPWSDLSVTIDTHAGAAALLEPLAGGDEQIVAAMSGPGADAVGISGTNAIFAEAYFQLADELTQELGFLVLPREVQSVTWEAGRGLFKPEQKREKPKPGVPTLQEDIRALWEDFAAGKMGLDELHTRITERAGGIGPPDWKDTPSRLADDEGELRERVDVERPGARQLPARRGDRGAGAAVARGGAAEGVGRPAPPQGLIRSHADADAFDRATAPEGVAPAPVRGTRTLAQPDDTSGKRGSITIGPGGQLDVRLFEKANLSTFLHEALGHGLFEIYGDLVEQLRARGDPATLSPTQQRFLQDYDTLLAKLGVEDRSQIGVKEHEQLAKWMEQYLREGKAPSAELRPVFARIRGWLLDIYQTLQTLGVPLTPEVREVFDRMFATDAQIAAAQQQANVSGMFATADEAGMSPDEFARYQATIADADRQAKEGLDAHLLDEVSQEQTARRQAQRESIHTQVEAEVQQQPVYRALSAMERGTTPAGEPLVEGEAPQPLKLSKAILVERYAGERMKTIPRSIITTSEDGLDPDLVAEMFGFSSGDALLQAVEAAPDMDALIAQETDRRLAEANPSAVEDGTLPERARNAVGNEAREEVVRQELAALEDQQSAQQAQQREQRPALTPQEALRGERRERAYERKWLEAEARLRIAIAEGRKQVEIDRLREEVRTLRQQARGGAATIRRAVPTVQQVREAARQQIAGTKIADLQPQVYWHAANQAGRQATEAAARQQFPEAIAAKTKQLLNLALYREAVAQREAVVDGARWVREHNTKAARQKLGLAGQGYLDQWDAKLDQYEFARVSQKVLDRRGDLQKWIAEQKGEGTTLDLPPAFLNESRRVNYRQLTVEQFTGLVDGLKHLEHVAAFKNKLITAKETRDRDAVATTIAERIRQTGTAVAKRQLTQVKTLGEKVAKYGRDLAGSFLSADTMLRALDGYVDLGPVYQHLKGGIDRAYVEAYIPRAGKAAERLQQINSVYKRGELQRKVFIAALNQSLTREEMVSILLNWGNAGGREAVLTSGTFKENGWDATAVEAIFNKLDQRDVDYAQSVLDFLEEFWPEIEATQRRRTGLAPQRVEALPIQTRFGTVRGGYYPLKANPETSRAARQNRMEDVYDRMRAGRFVAAATKAGFAIERVGFAGQDVLLNLSVISSHIQEVIYDLALGDEIRATDRLLRHPTVQNAFQEAGRSVFYDTLDIWLRDVAATEIAATDWLSKSSRFVRSGAASSVMLYNVNTAVLNLAAPAQSMVVVGKRAMLRGIADLVTRPVGKHNVFQQVIDASPFMKERQTNYNKDFMTAMENVKDRRVPLAIHKMGFWLITKSQWIADVVTWLGAYNKGLAQFDGDDTKATHYADRMVARAQGSGLWADRTALERGSIGSQHRQVEAVKALTTLMSYQMAKLNVAYERVATTNVKSPAALAHLTLDVALMFGVEAFLAALIHGKFTDDDDGWGWFGTLMSEAGDNIINMLPILRDLYTAHEGRQPTAGGPMGQLWQRAASAMHQIEQGEFDAALVKSLNSLAGIVVKGYPSSAINRVVTAGTKAAEGEDVTPLDYLITQQPQNK